MLKKTIFILFISNSFSLNCMQLSKTHADFAGAQEITVRSFYKPAPAYRTLVGHDHHTHYTAILKIRDENFSPEYMELYKHLNPELIILNNKNSNGIRFLIDPYPFKAVTVSPNAYLFATLHEIPSPRSIYNYIIRIQQTSTKKLMGEIYLTHTFSSMPTLEFNEEGAGIIIRDLVQERTLMLDISNIVSAWTIYSSQ